MQRKISRLLGLGAILGVAATGVLVVLVLGGGSGAARREGRADPTDEPLPGPGARGGGGVRPDAPSGTGGPGLRVPQGEGSRTPFDGPDAVRETTRMTSRVAEILNRIQSIEDVHVDERRNLFTELETLLRSLGNRVDRTTRNEMLRLLATVEGKWRPLVGEALGCLRGDVETAKALMGMLQERPTSVYTRSAILGALGKMQVKDVLPDLVATLGQGYDSEPLVVRAIGQIGGPEASQALLELLDRPLARDTAAEIERVIGQAANPKVMEEVKRRLEDAPPKTRASLLDILAMTGDAAHAPAVRELLATETDAAARRNAITALGRFGDPASGAVLLRLLESGAEDDRQSAMRAMERVRNPETVEALAGAYGTLGEAGRISILVAGSRSPTPPPKMVEIAKEGLRDPVERIRIPSARILGQRGRDEHVDLLADYLKRADNLRERSAGFQALRQVGTRKAAEAALALLDVLPERQRESQRLFFERMLGGE